MVYLLWLALCGAVFGIANVIPGVSGGTMAVAMGVYDQFIESIGDFRKDWKKSLRFLIPFLTGAGAAILLFSKLIEELLEAYPMQLNFFFCGLILGCVPLLAKTTVQSGIKPSGIFAFLFAFGLMIASLFFVQDESGQVFESVNAMNLLKLFFAGIIAAVAMIIPGVSGSMLLVVLGVYWTVLAAVNDMNLILLAPFGLGVLIGFFAGAKVIAVCMRKYAALTYSIIMGLVIGSLVQVFYASGFSFSLDGVVSILLLGVGAVLSWLISRGKQEKPLKNI